MSSHTRASTNAGEEQDAMQEDLSICSIGNSNLYYLRDAESEPRAASAASSSENDGSLAMLLQDSVNWLAKVRALKESDLIILLTPVVPPTSNSTEVSDPFEPLGRSLAKRHARIRHVPYVPRNGLTSTHLTFIQRGHAIILCLAVQPSQRIPLEIADVLFASHDHKPSIIIVLSSLSPGETYHHRETIPFPTVILTKGHSPAALEAAASLIYANPSPKPSPPPLPQLPHNPTTWPVTPFDDTLDTPEIHALWTETLPARFSLSPATLSSLLHRPGYAKHYTVRSPPSSSSTSPILGFCATYLTYADREGEDLVACLAVLLVRRDARSRGIGRTLHDHALRELGRTRGVARFQLGSTFPRLLAGPLLGELGMGGDAEEWFGRRGWRMKSPKIPGQGGVVRDLVLDLREWKTRGPGPGSGSGSGEVGFRAANQEDMNEVLELVDTTAKRLGRMGWFDQYAALMNGPNVKDVILSVEAERIVAVALTYTPSCGSQISSNLPWAGRTGDDVGGVTCICISDHEEAQLLPQLLDACVRNLRMNGMARMFIDSISIGLEDLKLLGFKEWAAYKHVWRDT